MYYLEVIDAKTGLLLGRLVDITVDGILLITEDILNANVKFDLKLILPEKIQGIDEVRFAGRCVRSEKDTNSRYYYSGFEFESIEPSHKHIIELLISGYEF